MKYLLLTALLISSAAIAENAIEKNYLNKPIDLAVEKFGFPSSVMELQKSKIYVWMTDQAVSMPVVTYAPVYGTFGNQPLQLNQMQTNYQQIHLHCTLKLMVDEKHLVTHYEMEGNAGCDRFK